MGMRTVYIRKDNEETFDGLPNKSEVINWTLEQIKKKKDKEPRYVQTEPTA